MNIRSLLSAKNGDVIGSLHNPTRSPHVAMKADCTPYDVRFYGVRHPPQ